MYTNGTIADGEKIIDFFINKVFNQDCLEILQQLPSDSVDLILQDPPYNQTALDFEWDIFEKIDQFWEQWLRVVKDNGAIVMTATQPFTSKLVVSNLKAFKHEWIWVKNVAAGMMLAGKAPMKRHESILVFGKGRTKFNPQKILGSLTSQNHSKKGYKYKNNTSKLYNVEGGVEFVWSEYVNPHSVLPCNAVGNRDKEKVHPNQKPIALFEYIIKTYTDEGDVVFDGFAGSGTTAVACNNLNRRWILCETDQRYCEIIKGRLA